MSMLPNLTDHTQSEPLDIESSVSSIFPALTGTSLLSSELSELSAESEAFFQRPLPV